MTNEEMAVEIRNGNNELISDLWSQTVGFFTMRASSIYLARKELCNSAGIERDDIFQLCFIALCDAVAAYKPASGYKLLAYVNYPLKTHFNALCGIRSSKRDALNYCKSLDEAIGDNDDFTLLDTIADPNSEEAFVLVEEKVFQDELNIVIESSLVKLTKNRAAVLRGLFFDGKTGREIAADLGVSQQTINQSKYGGFGDLRRDVRLRAISGEILISAAWSGTGLKAFNEAWSSSVERALESAERYEGDFWCEL